MGGKRKSRGGSTSNANSQSLIADSKFYRFFSALKRVFKWFAGSKEEIQNQKSVKAAADDDKVDVKTLSSQIKDLRDELRKEHGDKLKDLDELRKEHGDKLTEVKGELTEVRGELTTVRGELTTEKRKLTTVGRELTTVRLSLAEGACAWNRPFFCNLASQILLFAVNQQPRIGVPEPRYFANFVDSRRSESDINAMYAQFGALRDAYNVRSMRDLAVKLDSFLGVRNSKIHYSSVATLEEDVDLAISLIRKFPLISGSNSVQIQTIQEYNNWKLAFPGRFTDA
jgi:hypothetical protein